MYVSICMYRVRGFKSNITAAYPCYPIGVIFQNIFSQLVSIIIQYIIIRVPLLLYELEYTSYVQVDFQYFFTHNIHNIEVTHVLQLV